MESKEHDTIFWCQCYPSLISGYASEKPKPCPSCGKPMTAFKVTSEDMPPAYEPPPIVDKLAEAYAFCKESHTQDEWIDWFTKCGLTYGLHNGVTYEIFTTLINGGRMPDDMQLPILIDLYTNMKTQKTCKHYFKKALKVEPPEMAKARMAGIREQLAELIDQDGNIMIYRGVGVAKFGKASATSLELNRAISFTTSYDKAVWFAQRFPAEQALVYTARVPIDDIVYYTDEREEEEAIFIPKKGKTQDYIISTEEVAQRDWK